MTDSSFATIDFPRFFGPDPGGSTAISGIQNFALTMPSDDFDGEDAVPAHRGLVYIVFEDFPLDEFGNRIPPITAEISFAGAPEAVVRDVEFLEATGYSDNHLALDPARGQFYYYAGGGYARARTTTMREELRVPEADILEDINGPQVVDPDGNIYATVGITEQSFRKIDGHTLQVVASASFASNVQLDVVSAYTLTGRIDFVLALGLLGAPARVFYASDLTVFWEGQGVSTRPRGVVGGLSEFSRTSDGATGQANEEQRTP